MRPATHCTGDRAAAKATVIQTQDSNGNWVYTIGIVLNGDGNGNHDYTVTLTDPNGNNPVTLRGAGGGE